MDRLLESLVPINDGVRMLFSPSPPPPISGSGHKLSRRLVAALISALLAAGSLLLGAVPAAAAAGTQADPLRLDHGNQKVRFWLGSDGEPRYEVDYKGKKVIENSRLGLVTVTTPDVIADRMDYTRGLKVVGDPNVGFRDHSGSWQDNFGSRSTMSDNYRELTVKLQAPNGFRFDIVFRAYDEGVAFKYVFPKSATVPTFKIGKESSEFNLDRTATAYVSPNESQQAAVVKKSVDQLNDPSAIYARPMTVVGNGYAVGLTEANQNDYARMMLKPVGATPGTTESGTLQSWLKENPVSVDRSAKDFSSPWRTFVLGDNEGMVVERSHLIKTLSPAPDTVANPNYADTSWIKPGTVLRPMSLNTADCKNVIDTMVARNIDYLGIDAGWYGSENDPAKNNPIIPIPNFDPKAIGDYAHSKGKKVILYVNYRGLVSYYQQGKLDSLFQQFSEWNIDGVKFGFVPVGSQATTGMVYDWVKMAASHKLVVDIHDEMLSTGVERTYPNLLTMEGVRGDEENPDAAGDIRTLFTRGVNGAADHTWTHSLARHTSKSFRYAGAVAFYSPLQFLYWYDTPAKINNTTPELWDNLPTTWDYTKFLEAKNEEYATVSRKSGNEWWIGSLSAVSRTANISLANILPAGVKYRAAIFEQDPSNPDMGVVTKVQVVDSSTVLKPVMTANSGYAVRLSPQ
ncbi:glycoside hydrolase family 97 N-terminal domain-containing protein [Streptomyces sp. NPDC048637]|uniref:glycoside hydrolase family 97 protein n=1 Tax=Streptomyces sp. NPDC048637 TaxID=3155636 RepID=UPI00341B72E9